MKIIFMGSPAFAAPSLIKLLENNFSISAIFTSPSKPSGRGQKVNNSVIHNLANQYNLEVYTPSTLKDQNAIDLISKIDADLIIVIAYGFIIPKAILESKKLGAINVHPSSLPKFRGAAPLQHTILSGDCTTSVCIMQMDEGIDTGPVLMSKDLDLPSDITFQQLHDVTAEMGAYLLIQTLRNIESIKPVAQDDIGSSYACKITKKDAKINWQEQAIIIERKVRSFNPSPCAFFEYNEEIFKVFSASAIDVDHKASAGTILNDNLLVACAHGTALDIKQIQRAGKNILEKKEFLRGYKLEKNTLLN